MTSPTTNLQPSSSRDTTPSTSQEESAMEELKEPITPVDHVPTTTDEEKSQSLSPSNKVRRTTSFAADPVKPTSEKEGEAIGYQGGVRPTRTFSKREASSNTGEDSHFFGGDIQRVETEQRLEQLVSRAEEKDQIVVNWEGEDDPENPKKWSLSYKWYLTMLSGLLVLNSTFTSSAPSGVTQELIAYFGFSSEVATLTIAIFVGAYCVGPLFWGPFSERAGRVPALLIALFIYTCFNVGCALAKNTGSILVFRFLAGSFASSPLVVTGGIIADVHDAKQRGLALSLFALAPFAGPALGPIVSGAISVTGTNWRWLFWVCAMFSGVCFAITLLTCKETYAPVILVRKAKRIRKETGDDRYVAPLELTPLEVKDLLKVTIAKPFIILFNEPMLMAVTLYLSFVYGTIYLLFEAFPFVFVGVYGFNPLESGLVFLFLFVGGSLGTLVYALFVNPAYSKLVDASPNGRVAPEVRLNIAMVGGPMMVISFFWFGWTSYASVSYWAPMLAILPLGFAVQWIFLGLFNNIVDTYLMNAASALAANTVCRSSFGAGFPMFASQMYEKLNQHWASTLLGFIALLLAPVPFLLKFKGPKLRAMSKYAPDI